MSFHNVIFGCRWGGVIAIFCLSVSAQFFSPGSAGVAPFLERFDNGTNVTTRLIESNKRSAKPEIAVEQFTPLLEQTTSDIVDEAGSGTTPDPNTDKGFNDAPSRTENTNLIIEAKINPEAQNQALEKLNSSVSTPAADSIFNEFHHIVAEPKLSGWSRPRPPRSYKKNGLAPNSAPVGAVDDVWDTESRGKNVTNVSAAGLEPVPAATATRRHIESSSSRTS